MRVNTISAIVPWIGFGLLAGCSATAGDDFDSSEGVGSSSAALSTATAVMGFEQTSSWNRLTGTAGQNWGNLPG